MNMSIFAILSFILSCLVFVYCIVLQTKDVKDERFYLYAIYIMPLIYIPLKFFATPQNWTEYFLITKAPLFNIMLLLTTYPRPKEDKSIKTSKI